MKLINILILTIFSPFLYAGGAAFEIICISDSGRTKVYSNFPKRDQQGDYLNYTIDHQSYVWVNKMVHQNSSKKVLVPSLFVVDLSLIHI